MRIAPLADNASIVFVGRFNPAIFHPAWFALNKLVGEKDAEAAKLNISHPEITQFSLSQFAINVTPERFAITSLDPHPEHIRDLVIACFGQWLPHAPVRSMGINRTIRFDTGNRKTRDLVGDALAPKAAWGDWGREIEASRSDPDKAHGGMTSLTMRQMPRPDGQIGHIEAKVGPAVDQAGQAISVEVNDHFNLHPETDPVYGAEAAVRTVESQWEISMARAAKIADQIMALVEDRRAGAS